MGQHHVPAQTGDSKQNNTLSAPLPSESVLKKESSLIKNIEKNVKPSAGIVQDTPKEKNVTIAGDTIWVENDKIVCGISEIGARIISLKMKDYVYANNKDAKDSVKQNINLLEQGEMGGANLTINGQNYDQKKFVPIDKEKIIRLSKKETKTLDFSYKDEENNTIIKRFFFEGNSYKIGFNVLSGSLDGKSIVIGWNGGITESEDRFNNGNRNASGASEPRKIHVFDGKNVTHIQMKKTGKEEETGFYKWAALTSKYFMIALVADTMKNAVFFLLIHIL